MNRKSSWLRLGQKIIWALQMQCSTSDSDSVKQTRSQNQAETPSDFLLKDSIIKQVESVGVEKVLQSGKNAMEILDAMDIYTPEKR
jgi:hypothetical protein